MATLRDNERFDVAAMVHRLHAGKPGRIVLAYMDVGQAERYRSLTAEGLGTARPRAARASRLHPDPRPRGWSDDYPVAYWDARWQQLMAPTPTVRSARSCGPGSTASTSTGSTATTTEAVAAEAKRQRIDPAHAMVDWIGTIRRAASESEPHA